MSNWLDVSSNYSPILETTDISMMQMSFSVWWVSVSFPCWFKKYAHLWVVIFVSQLTTTSTAALISSTLVAFFWLYVIHYMFCQCNLVGSKLCRKMMFPFIITPEKLLTVSPSPNWWNSRQHNKILQLYNLIIPDDGQNLEKLGPS